MLRKIRAFLPLSQLVKYYNAVTRLVMSYARIFWSSCHKEQLYRVLKFQKCAARVIDFTRIARRLLLPSLKSSLGSRFINNQGLISVLLFISVLMGLYCLFQVPQRNLGRTNFFGICGETTEQCPVRYTQGRLATLF